jgi:CRP/FNR family transcriptional regulator, dissimilatory nitrate respiration regulator
MPDLSSGDYGLQKSLKLNARDRDILLRSRLLVSLDLRLQKRMLDCAVVTAHPNRDIIVEMDSQPQQFFVVLNGHVRLYRIEKDGREADIAIYGPGDVFAECAMFLEECYPFQVQAAEATTLARFDAEKIRPMFAEEPALALCLMRIMAFHAMDARLSVANDRLHTAPQRVARYLLELWHAHGGPGNAFKLPFQKSLLAGKLGLAPEALSRAFSMLRKAGVSIRGRMVQITDAEALRNF